MRSRKRMSIIVLWVMFLCAVFMAGGCRADVRDETELTDMKESDVEESDIEKSAKEKTDDDTGKKETGNFIYVDVCGQVKAPGVYKVSVESRVYEAIEKAGGMTEQAASSYLNQAEKLTDGEQIYVPSKDEVKDEKRVGSNSSDKGQEEGKVNLNTATKEELMTLSGIGEVKADAIIRYRQEQGMFQSIEDIKKIEGIKDGVFNKVKDQIKI